MKALFVSIWDGGVEIETGCQFDPSTRIVSDIINSDVDDVDILDSEIVRLYDGTEFKVLNFDDFQELWLEQECEVNEDKGHLKDSIGDCDDFDDLLQTINMWSTNPVRKRVYQFLLRNNACAIIDSEDFPS